VLSLVCVAILWAGEVVFTETILPRQETRLAIDALNGGDAEAAKLRAYRRYSDAAMACAVLLTLAILIKGVGMKPKGAALVPLIALFSLGGCMKSYDTPEYSEIDTSETGFLIPLEGGSADQAKFASEKYLEEKKVAAKRVQIIHRWNQTGRMHNAGRWIPTVRLVKVKRSPITRQWTAETTTGTANANQAIWTESKDSVSFSMGFTCTALIREEDAAKFLYFYPSGSLAEVMDTEVRGRVQKIASEISAKYNLDELRGKKQEIIDAVSSDAIAFFAERGITITTMGMFGGMTYENLAIQKAIDETFIAQQQKEIATAELMAQQKQNERLELAANGAAEQRRRVKRMRSCSSRKPRRSRSVKSTPPPAKPRNSRWCCSLKRSRWKRSASGDGMGSIRCISSAQAACRD
jgi:hypothetical protein